MGISHNITLYAKWIRTYTVTFDAGGGTPAPAAQAVTSGGKATEPAAMTRAGQTFGGWYKEITLTTPWNFAEDTVTGNITLYAKWLSISTYYTGDGITFKMVSVPGGITFPTGEDDDGTATVANAYEIGETEVSYELWYAVRAWAETNGYTFYDNPGAEGSSGPRYNTTPSANKQEPVTMVTWFDAVVWLNALTEWVNVKTGSNLTPVYYYDSTYAANKVAKNSNPSSNFVKENSSYNYASAYAKPGATGFRLPTSNEWELAARWRNNSTNTVSGYTNPWFTKGDSASGATASYGTSSSAASAVAWYYGNITGTKKTQAVKGKAANALGLYDMSGNAYEWCFDWYPGYSIGIYRIMRGGSWYSDGFSGYLRVGDVRLYYPASWSSEHGFRPARTAQ